MQSEARRLEAPVAPELPAHLCTELVAEVEGDTGARHAKVALCCCALRGGASGGVTKQRRGGSACVEQMAAVAGVSEMHVHVCMCYTLMYTRICVDVFMCMHVHTRLCVVCVKQIHAHACTFLRITRLSCVHVHARI